MEMVTERNLYLQCPHHCPPNIPDLCVLACKLRQQDILSLLSLVPASAVSGNKLKESREHLA